MPPPPHRPPHRPPPPRAGRSAPGHRADVALATVGVASALVPALAVLAACAVCVWLAWPSFRTAPLGFFVEARWDPPAGVFGALPFLAGSAVTTVLALVVAAPVGLGAALFLAEIAPRRGRDLLDAVLDLVAAVPSVVWGLFALDALLPLLAETLLPPLLGARAGEIAPGGFGLLAGAIVLAVMVIPTTAAVAREVLRGVPRETREAAIALGATRWETVRLAVLPSVGGGLLGAVLLGLARALGEATAMAMVLGSRAQLPATIASPGSSAASLLLEQLGEASDPAHLAALGHVALALLVIAMLAQASARLLIDRSTPGRFVRRAP